MLSQTIGAKRALEQDKPKEDVQMSEPEEQKCDKDL